MWKITSVRLVHDRDAIWTVDDNAREIILGLGPDGEVSTVHIDLFDGRRVEIPRNQVTITWERAV